MPLKIKSTSGSVTLEAENVSGDTTLIVPSGTGSLAKAATVSTTAPSSPATGDMWFDTTAGTSAMKVWSGSEWHQMSNVPFSATGGTESTYSSGGANYKVHAFTSSGVFTISGSASSVDILVVAGGAGGGNNSNQRGSGGGAGGLVFMTNVDMGLGDNVVTVGNGGTEGGNGFNSLIDGITAIGGGSGGWSDNTDNGQAGGSGGGNWYPGYAGALANQPADITYRGVVHSSVGFGNNGGQSGNSQPYGSGGGGAGGAGGNYNSNPIGGIGKDYSSYFGTTYGELGWFSGGGGTGGYPPSGDVKYVGGQGGGGRGWNSGTEAAQNGDVNTGGGGGAGGTGGSGIVIVRYAV